MLRKRRPPRWLVVVLCIAFWVWLARAPLLRSLAGPLVFDEPAGDFNYVGILEWYGNPDGDQCFNAAAELFRRKRSCGVLVIESRRDRLVELGILPPFGFVSQCALKALGLPAQVVSTIQRDGCDDWANARALRAWMAHRPDASIVLLGSNFRSAHLRYVLNVVLDPDQAGRVRVRALRDRQSTGANWWTSRTGIKAFGTAWLRQLHGWCAGGDHLPPPSCSVADYEDQTRQVLTTGWP